MILYFKLRAFLVRLLMRILPFRSPLVLQGPDSSLQLCGQVGTLGFGRLLLVTDKVLREIGVLSAIEDSLRANGIEYEIFDEILPDPTFAQVQAGEARLRETGSEAIMAIGGGSVLDAAKMMSVLHTNPGPLESFLPFQRCKNTAVPFFAVPTTAGTGSEATPVAVITDPDSHKKTPVIDTRMIPGYVALDPVIMRGMPAGITAATGMDALTHAVEAYISRGANPDSDLQAEAATRLIFRYLPRAFEYGDDLEARESMAMAAFYAASAFSRTSVGYAHAIAHQLGSVCGTPHGNANAMVLPEVLQAYGPCVHPRLAQLATVAGLSEENTGDGQAAARFIEAIVHLRKQLQLPTLPRGLKFDQIDGMVKEARLEAGELYPVPRYFSAAELRSIVRGLLPASQPEETELVRNV